MIPYGKQNISKEDIEEVVKVLQSDFLTQGSKVPEFENAVSSYCKVSHGVAVNSATSALHIACLALGLGQGDTLWTSPNTFVASANCALYCGAEVDFVDIDPQTYNISVVDLENKLIEAEKNRKLPKIVIPVHFAGQSCKMEEIYSLSKKYGFRIIEDASHAVGGKYKDQVIGSCKYSDITVFSFHPVKIITTAEGGMALTNDKDLAESMSRLRSHGITRDKSLMTEESHGAWYYQQLQLGFNYRMTELQAALGVSQIKRLDEFVSKRNSLAERYSQLVEGLPVQSPFQHNESYSSFHLYPVLLHNSEKHGRVFQKLRESGVGVNLHYIPVHIQPFYLERGFRSGDFPVAEAYYQKAISLPLYYDLKDEQQDKVVEALKGALEI